MSSTEGNAIAAQQTKDRPPKLTPEEHRILSKRRFSEAERNVIAHLLDPFEATLRTRVIDGWTSGPYLDNYCQVANHFLARMMVALDGTYWAFDWESMLAWRDAMLEREAERCGAKKRWRQDWMQLWRCVTSALFLMGAIPYHEAIYEYRHRNLAEKWLGEERVLEIERQFLETAKGIGYRSENLLRGTAVSSLIATLLHAGKKDLEKLTKEDLETWQAQTGHSSHLARKSVTCIQKVLAAMGYLEGELPRWNGKVPNPRFNWGKTTPEIVETFERFLSDMTTVRESSTVHQYRCALRRFGDWMGEHYPDIESVADVRREHIEAFKVAVIRMRCGDHTVSGEGNGPPTARFGQPLARKSQAATLAKVRAFFSHIEALEYPERPGRTLWIRGDLIPMDEQVPRAIPEDDWRRLTDLAERLTPELAEEYGFTGPFERTRAVFAVLFECALRGGEMCRLDTGCLLAAWDERTEEQTHWLRVPIGKGHDDRMVPVRPHLVEAIDAWMRVRGPQPPGWDKRTDQARDFLFSWQGKKLTTNALNAQIDRLCSHAETSERYTSHRFRHTLAMLWRKRGMKLETIGRMLGHKKLELTMRYAAVMPPELRKEFEEAFAAIDEEHRATAQIRVLLSPEAHVEAQKQWRESMFVDLGIGWCGLTAYHPCETRLACHTCPNFLPDKERLPLLENQRRNLIELRGLTKKIPSPRKADAERELDGAIGGLDENIAAVDGKIEETEE